MSKHRYTVTDGRHITARERQIVAFMLEHGHAAAHSQRIRATMTGDGAARVVTFRQNETDDCGRTRENVRRVSIHLA